MVSFNDNQLAGAKASLYHDVIVYFRSGFDKPLFGRAVTPNNLYVGTTFLDGYRFTGNDDGILAYVE